MKGLVPHVSNPQFKDGILTFDFGMVDDYQHNREVMQSVIIHAANHTDKIMHFIMYLHKALVPIKINQLSHQQITQYQQMLQTLFNTLMNGLFMPQWLSTNRDNDRADAVCRLLHLMFDTRFIFHIHANYYHLLSSIVSVWPQNQYIVTKYSDNDKIAFLLAVLTKNDFSGIRRSTKVAYQKIFDSILSSVIKSFEATPRRPYFDRHVVTLIESYVIFLLQHIDTAQSRRKALTLVQYVSLHTQDTIKYGQCFNYFYHMYYYCKMLFNKCNMDFDESKRHPNSIGRLTAYIIQFNQRKNRIAQKGIQDYDSILHQLRFNNHLKKLRGISKIPIEFHTPQILKQINHYSKVKQCYNCIYKGIGRSDKNIKSKACKCKAAFYCCRMCQKEHWVNVHRARCRWFAMHKEK